MTCPKCHHPNSPAQLLCRGCQQPLRCAKLRVIEANGKEQYLELNNQDFTIGRCVSNDLALADDGVSRVHARFRFVAGAYLAEDLGSKNGLFVNGTQTVSQPLVAMDCLQLGTTRIYYMLRELTHAALAARLNFSATGKTLTRGSAANVAAQPARAEGLFEQALHPLLQGVLLLAQAERATLWLPDSGGDLIPRLSAGAHNAANHLTVEQPIALKIFRSGGTILRERAEATEIFCEGLATDAECAYQLLGLPLRLVHEVSSHERPPLGALLLHSRTPTQKLIPAKLERLKRFLAQAEVSLSRVEIVTATLRALEMSADSFASEAVALAVQKQVLPVAIPRVAGYDLACWFNPAEVVSGDYLDVVPLDSGEVLLVVGDVAGKSLAAAMTIFALQTAVHLFARYEADLEKIVAHLNRVAHAVGGAAIFTTLFLGVLDPQRRTLQYINAGHTPG
ncbi:MAG: SpoIIE family protein phosphatase, partial [candidate division KSB1 bacterium]